jgi:hypothetical protein
VKECLQSSGMLSRVAFVRTYVSEEIIASNNRVLRLLITANVVPSSLILVALMMEDIHASESSALTRDTRHNISEDDILYSHRRDNLKSYMLDTTVKQCRVLITSYCFKLSCCLQTSGSFPDTFRVRTLTFS